MPEIIRPWGLHGFEILVPGQEDWTAVLNRMLVPTPEERLSAAQRYLQARHAFSEQWGFDPAPTLERAFRNGWFDLEGGTEEQRTALREILRGEPDGR